VRRRHAAGGDLRQRTVHRVSLVRLRVAEAFVQRLEAAGVVVSARAPDAGVEGIELPGHPFFVATLFQPQVGALAGRPLHPLIGAFIEACRLSRTSSASASR
jgi:CTP synthase (UTP-ammonia lyase)